MTTAFADGPGRPDNRELVIWGASLAGVLILHVVAALLVLHREAPIAPPKPPPAAFLDLPPLPPAGAGGAAPVPQPPKPAINQPTPPKPPAQETVPPKPPAPLSTPKLTVPLPATPKPKLAMPRPQPPRTAQQPPSSLSGSAPIVRLSAVGLWQAGVIDRIMKFKSWPPAAVRGRLTGTAGLRIEIDRQGKILSYSLSSSSGYDLLDRATLDMARRAQSLPPLPPEIPGQTHQFVLSVEWL